jgi:drug/metabolite transporter (DMT)-like permease
MAGLLYLGSGVGPRTLLLFRMARGHSSNISWPRGSELLWLLGAIAAGGGLGPYLLMVRLQTTDSASALLILNLEGVLTALLTWFVFKENFDGRIAIGMGLIVAGGVALTLGPTLRLSGCRGAAEMA